MIIFMYLISIFCFFLFINKSIKSIILIFKFISTIYDLISFPVYFLIQKPNFIKLDNQFANEFHEANDDYWEIEKLEETNQIQLSTKQNQLKEKLKDVKHFSEFIAIIRELYSGLKCIGRRKLINKIKDKKDGRLKYELSDQYEWLTYDEILNIIDNLIKSFHHKLLLKKGDRIAIMAETSLEWITTLFASQYLGCELITLHSSLDHNSICYILNSTNPKYLFTHSNIIKLINNDNQLKSNLNNIPKLIKFNNQFVDDLTTDNEIKNLDFYQYEQLIEDAKLLPGIDCDSNNYQEQQFSPDDIALILFTSGSTGQPKGVLLTHSNIIDSAKNYINRLPLSFNMNNDDTFLCYLPISHSFEMICEITFFLSGIKLAYGTPSTLTDGSLLLSENSKGDIQAANATIWVAVPLVFERVQNRIKKMLKNRGQFVDEIYQFVFEYKKKWIESGYKCDLIDKIFFEPIQKQYGGNLKYLISGGSLLREKTQIFLKNYLNVNFILSYGATECAVISMSAYNQSKHGSAMVLHDNIRCKLVEWKEGGYSPKNKPNAQGELLYSSKSLSIGYLNNEKETKKSFFIENGIRYWRSGDIGTIDKHGKLTIIDRKKDLAKLACGKYVALGKIESIFKNCEYVENIVMHCNSFYDHLIAIVQPNLDNLIKLAKSMKLDNLNNLDKLCENKQLTEIILNKLRNYGELNDLSRKELPYLIKLSSELWTPSNNLLTASFKVNRTKIYSHFKQSINLMYKELDNSD